MDIARLRELADSGWTLPEIARELGEKYNSVYVAARRNQITAIQRKTPKPKSKKRKKRKNGPSGKSTRINQLYEQGASIAQLAAWYKMTPESVKYHLGRCGWSSDRPRYTPEDDAAIISTIEDLAERIGRPASHVANRARDLYFLRDGPNSN